MLGDPAAHQGARAGRQQDQPAHRGGHAAQQRRGRHGLAQRQEVDEHQHTAHAGEQQHRRKRRHTPGPDRCQQGQQPTQAAGAKTDHDGRPRPESGAEAMPHHAGPHRAQAQAGVTQADGLLAQAQAPAGMQDLHALHGVVAELPATHQQGQCHQQRGAPHEAQPGAQVAREMQRARLGPGFDHRQAAQDGGREHQHQRIHQQGQRRTHEADQHPRQAWAGHLGTRTCQGILGMRLDQAITLHHLGQDNLGRTARRSRYTADHEADAVQPAHAEPAEVMRHRHAGHRQGDGPLARDIDRQFAHPVQPDPAGQREQRERQGFDCRQQAHLHR